MKKIFISISLLFFSLSIFNFAFADSQKINFMGAKFANKLCSAWNKSPLPKKLGALEIGGNNWIFTKNKYTGKIRNKQIILIWRDDCKNLPKMQLTIKYIAGKAHCSYGGRMTENYKTAEWALAPNTTDWLKFSKDNGWEINKFFRLFKTFRGDLWVARANFDNLKIFWKLVGKVTKSNKIDFKTGCKANLKK